jgi:hypothetical protein
MMRRLQDCRTRAFAEAGSDLRPPAILRGDYTPADLAGLYCANLRPPHFALFPLPEPFLHTRTGSQENIQSP